MPESVPHPPPADCDEPQSPLRFGFAFAGVLAAVALLLCAVAPLTSYLPARRATGLDPMLALRGE